MRRIVGLEMESEVGWWVEVNAGEFLCNDISFGWFVTRVVK
jgi:hypothetical protein